MSPIDVIRQKLGLGRKVPHAQGGRVLATDDDGLLTETLIEGDLIGQGGVGLSRLEDVTGPSVLGRSSGTGSPSVLSASTDGQVLRRSGGSVGFGSIANADLPTAVQAVEGSWTPFFTCASPGDMAVSYTRQVGRYHRSGTLVYVQYWCIGTVTYSTASGAFHIGGLPFAGSNHVQSGVAAGVMVVNSGLTGATSRPEIYTLISSLGTTMSIVTKDLKGVNNALLITGEVVSGATVSICGNHVYMTD